MISHVSLEQIVTGWPAIAEQFEKFFNSECNFDTLPALKKRLLSERCHLFLYTSPDTTFHYLFIGETVLTPTKKVFKVTHTAGINGSGSRYTPSDIREIIVNGWAEIEEMAKTLGHEVMMVNARPGHIRMLPAYKKATTTIYRELKE